MNHATEGSRAEACKGEPTVASGWYWGRELPGRAVLSSADDFEARVERAWARLWAGFSVDEHERLRESLAQLNALNKREDR